MMQFHLQFPVAEFKNKINYKQKIMFVGSCFAENIGSLFLEHKLDVLINTHGVLYNPWSITNSLKKCVLNQPVNDSNLFYANELWNSWEHHSKFSDSTKEKSLQNINSQIENGHNFLLTADWLVITLGSSFVYKHIENNLYVANCHKIPQNNFEKQLLNTNETITLLKETIQELSEKNKKLKIIFTVSPVRYIRDGVVENNLSKARLIDAVHTLVNRTENCFYFPAYELVMDDLRDYRFFEKDLVHPTKQAIEYVFDKFVDAVFDIESKKIIGKIKEIIAAKKHRPTGVNSELYKTFKKTFLIKCIALRAELPFLNLQNEINFFE